MRGAVPAELDGKFACAVELVNGIVYADISISRCVCRENGSVAENILRAELRNESAAGIELLNAVVAGICDVEVPLPVNAEAGRLVELSGAGSRRSELRKIYAVVIELFDAVVRGVGDENVSGAIGHNACRPRKSVRNRVGILTELPDSASGASETGKQSAGWIKFQYGAAVIVQQEDVALRVQGQAIA